MPDRADETTAIPPVPEPGDQGGVHLVRTARLVDLSSGREIELDGGAFTFGRGPENDLAIDMPNISRNQGRITCRPDGFYLEDMGSTNGTFVGERRVREAVKLAQGDLIRIRQKPDQPETAWSATFHLWYRAVETPGRGDGAAAPRSLDTDEHLQVLTQRLAAVESERDQLQTLLDRAVQELDAALARMDGIEKTAISD